MSRAQSTLPKRKQLDNGIIKKFSNINKTLETCVAMGFEPSDDLAGGDWYSDGKLDTEFIDMLKRTSLMGIKDKAGEIEMSRAQSTLPKKRTLPKRKQLDNGIIKKFSNIDKTLETCVAMGFEPSDDLAGGDWYSDGKLDTEFIDMLKRTSLMGIKDKAGEIEMSRAQSTLPKKRKQLDKGIIIFFSNIDKTLETHVATGFEPSDDLASRDWYSDGKLDTEFIDMLKRTCLMGIKDKAATLKGIWEYVRRLGAFDEKFTTLERIREIMDSLLLEKEVVKVKSTGTGEFALIPYGDTCYKCTNRGTGGGQVKVGALA